MEEAEDYESSSSEELPQESIPPKVSLRKYVLPELERNQVLDMLVVGKQGAGKSVLVFNLIRSGLYLQFKRMILFCASDKIGSSKVSVWDQIAWTKKYDQFSPELAEAVFNAIPEDDYDTLIVFDDVIAEKHFKEQGSDGIINIMTSRGRHKLLSLIIISQYYKAIPKQTRNSITHFIYFRQSYGVVREIRDEDGPGQESQWKAFPGVLSRQWKSPHDWVLHVPAANIWINGTKMEVISEISG
jgi:hypothetical protein